MPKKLSVADLRREAQRLIESGEMPDLDELLSAVAKARQKYAPRIKFMRAFGPDEPDRRPQ